MKTLFKVLVACCAVSLLSGVTAQTEVPSYVPPQTDNTAQPIGYPTGFAAPTFDQQSHLGGAVSLGDFEIELGRTPLSLAINSLGGKLHFTADKTPFLCYSASVKPVTTAKPSSKTESVGNEEAVGDEYQNIWLMIGSRGEISEVRIQKQNDPTQRCENLSDMFYDVSVGSIYINEIAKEVEKLKLPEYSAKSEDPERLYWFSLLPSNKQGIQEAGLFSIKFENGLVDQIISVMVPLKSQ